MANSPSQIDNHTVTRFGAIADGSRREILELLAQGPRSVQELAAAFPFSRPAVSKHLRVLREAGLVRETRQGRRRIYVLRREALAPVAEWLSKVLGRRRRAAAAAAPPRPEAEAVRRPAAPPSWAPWSS
jgi:DNA-binding transcriptional ArsR family regulator